MESRDHEITDLATSCIISYSGVHMNASESNAKSASCDAMTTSCSSGDRTSRVRPPANDSPSHIRFKGMTIFGDPSNRSHNIGVFIGPMMPCFINILGFVAD